MGTLVLTPALNTSLEAIPGLNIKSVVSQVNLIVSLMPRISGIPTDKKALSHNTFSFKIDNAS